ncbi:hypothetical protein [Nitrosococcus wardiae]|uniref:Uncharacterized protein n=1 Tax=Nitrosococcus wardiae TaxID=1814290 RepID=A0A4P7C162_9GAMM|nr:hypothetical protein [Nitrosococcus wardiae]QBQ55337.1 hypothetical protein E3U44_13080 [Nitrosococcus wardiae]
MDWPRRAKPHQRGIKELRLPFNHPVQTGMHWSSFERLTAQQDVFVQVSFAEMAMTSSVRRGRLIRIAKQPCSTYTGNHELACTLL